MQGWEVSSGEDSPVKKRKYESTDNEFSPIKKIKAEHWQLADKSVIKTENTNNNEGSKANFKVEMEEVNSDDKDYIPKLKFTKIKPKSESCSSDDQNVVKDEPVDEETCYRLKSGRIVSRIMSSPEGQYCITRELRKSKNKNKILFAKETSSLNTCLIKLW